MKKIRKSIFETNSSSTHSICIAKNQELEIPKSIYFEFGEFGWECNTLNSTEEKASYLYTGLFANGRKNDIDAIKIMLENKGIEVKFEEPIYNGKNYAENEGYVDHSNELGDFLDDVSNNEDKLLNYLLSPLSYIITGNDNDDNDVDIVVNYEHDLYYKGN